MRELIKANPSPATRAAAFVGVDDCEELLPVDVAVPDEGRVLVPVKTVAVHIFANGEDGDSAVGDAESVGQVGTRQGG
ncbi:hypothetical protein NUW54_g7617 [Trametes sanguinea]|uniref:Uncharacterized protein n=1 Tax=Trametes sanguinea TaxID=158606 RepID=A0ACC1PMH9_9APHY|nr:hypothetical protein NUW54_g7617 [Trametes sanguinea]